MVANTKIVAVNNPYLLQRQQKHTMYRDKGISSDSSNNVHWIKGLVNPDTTPVLYPNTEPPNKLTKPIQQTPLTQHTSNQGLLPHLLLCHLENTNLLGHDSFYPRINFKRIRVNRDSPTIYQV